MNTYVNVILFCVLFPDSGGVLHSSKVCAFHTFPMVVNSTEVNATVNLGDSYSFSCLGH